MVWISSAGMAAVHLGAQPAHMGFHDIGARIEIQLPDILQQHGAGDDAPGIAHQIFQQPEFLGLQIHGLPPRCTVRADQVHFQVAGMQGDAAGAVSPRRAMALTRATSSAKAKGLAR